MIDKTRHMHRAFLRPSSLIKIVREKLKEMRNREKRMIVNKEAKGSRKREKKFVITAI